MIKDLLLTLPSGAGAATTSQVRKALHLGGQLEAHISCVVGEPSVALPVTRHPYGESLERELTAREKEIHRDAESELAAFEKEAAGAGLAHDGRIVNAADGAGNGAFVEAARLHAITIVPYLDEAHSADLVQALVFGSGRPVLVLPDTSEESFGLDRVVVGWDFSRAAARALGDAMPLLRMARDVRLVFVNRDNKQPYDGSGQHLIAHLKRHDVDASLEEVVEGDGGVGEALDREAQGADLLVVGGFGHSRIRDFFLGGTTSHILKKPLRPTLMSH